MQLFMLVFIGYLVGSLGVLAGVALGGFLVYRTKRDSHEGLFAVRKPQEENNGPVNVDEFGLASDDEEDGDIMPSVIRQQTARFLRQHKAEKNEAKNVA